MRSRRKSIVPTIREILAREALQSYAREIASSLTEQVYRCAECKDTGLVVDPDYPGYAIECAACAHRRRAQYLQQLCGLTMRERLASLPDIRATANSDTARMVAAARRFIDAPVGFLTIYGTCGNAKTVVLQSIINACLARDIEAIYVTFYDALQWIRAGFSDETAQRRIDQLRAARVLAIDELDKVKESDWVIEFRNQLIDYRYRFGLDNQCGTVFAMNGEIDLLPEWLSSRLRDGRNVVIQNNDRDMRPLLRQR